MEVKIFTIRIHDRESVDELNRFLASHRITSIDREFIPDGQNSAWSICVTVQTGEPRHSSAKDKDRIDYREVLSESDFRIYAKLRTLRKELSEKDGVPAYRLFTNEQLAEIVRQTVTSAERLVEINGVGPARVEKYGDAFLAIMRAEAAQNGNDEQSSGSGNNEPNTSHA